MNRKFIASIAASVALGASSAFAAVTFSNVVTAASSAWDPTFGGGSSALAFAGGAVSEAVTATGGFLQTFTGDGNVLEGFGIHASGSGATGIWSIALIDYGVSSPVRSVAAFNSVASAVFADAFTNISFGTARQLYFDFTGGSRITLLSNHQYGIAIFASGGSGTLNVDRGADVYSSGSIGLGPIGTFGFPGSGAPRTSNFAVYTSVAAVPEPSSYAAILGLAAAGLAMSRRRKR